MEFPLGLPAVVALALAATAVHVSAFQSSSLARPPSVQPSPLTLCGVSTMSPGASSSNGLLLRDERDVQPMVDWCLGYGAQTAPGVQVAPGIAGKAGHSIRDNRENYGVKTAQAIPKGGPVLFIPAQLVLSSSNIQQEFGGSLDQSENLLAQYGASDRLPLFRIMVKILAEYEKLDQSPYFPWLNALPRTFYNGVSMTDACFACLPPYVAYLASMERDNYGYFFQALNAGNVPLRPDTISNDDIVRWAYNVALTRHQVVVPAVEKTIAPLADMINHGTYPNVEISYDGEGNCIVTAIRDIPAESQLTISLGDASNPTPLFATYGFLDDDCPGVFCKALDHQEEMQELKYDFTELLFGTEAGEIGTRVWNLFLYKLLKDNNDPNAQALLTAVRNKDSSTTKQLNQQYFQYTHQALLQHVDGIIALVDELTARASSYDVRTHPRVPVIVAHNNLVRDTFAKVQAQLYQMVQ